MKKILWLTSWYPNETNPFSGDFIKRQAEAVSVYQPLTILWVGKYEPGSHPHIIDHSNKVHDLGSLKEYILYFPSYEKTKPVFLKLKSQVAYFQRHLSFIKQLRGKNELPDLVHVQVAMKAGLIALYLKWKYKIPYVLTEHWTAYYAGAKDSLLKKSFITRYLTRLVLKNAARFLPVSDSLGNQIHQHWVQIPFQKIPNVVNTRFFYPSESQMENGFRFIHISTLLYPKNPEGIIRCFIKLLSQGVHADLVLVGPLNPALQEIIQSSRLPPEKIHCTGEIPYEQVGTELRKSSALVIFSFYENMPCVMLEALCTGIPVIATRVGGIPEVIQEDNGILINAGDENALLEAMKDMISSYHHYDKNKISQRAVGQFSYETIGKEIIRVYDSVLEKIN
jgi:glycosyltransferase involved in cell wall biosynthesis